MVQSHSRCRLTEAEINGIGASRCVRWQPRLREILFIAYAVHLHFVLFTCFLWKIWSLLEPNSKLSATNENGKMLDSYKSSEEWRLNSLSCRCFDFQALQIYGAIAQSLQADRGWDKWHWGQSLCAVTAAPPWNSLHCICCPSPLCALHMFLVKDLVTTWTKFQTQCNKWKRKNAGLIQVIWRVEIKQPFLPLFWFPSSPNLWCNRTVAAGWQRLR